MYKKGQKVLVVAYVVENSAHGKLQVEIAGHNIKGTPVSGATTNTPAMPPPDEGAFIAAAADDQETTPIVDFQETTPIVD